MKINVHFLMILPFGVLGYLKNKKLNGEILLIIGKKVNIEIKQRLNENSNFMILVILIQNFFGCFIT